MMKKNRIREGLKSNRKLKDSFYYFIVDNRIDWAIILGSVLCVLPYLASNSWYFILVKSLLLIVIIYISLKYLKLWNYIKDINTKKKDTFSKLKIMIKNFESHNGAEFNAFIDQFIEKIKKLAIDYHSKKDQYESFEDYIIKDKDVTPEIIDLLNKDIDLTQHVFGLSIGLFLSINELRILPKLKLMNYYKLLAVIILTFIFFIVYTIENSI